MKESHRECELKTRLLANRKGTFENGAQHSVAHCASAGRAAGAGLPEGLATASAVPPARGAPTSGRGARPPLPAALARTATRVRVSAQPPPLARSHPRDPPSPAAGPASGGAASWNRGTRGPSPGGGGPLLPRSPLSPGKSRPNFVQRGQVGGGPRQAAVPSQTPTSYSVMESPLSGGRMTQRSPRSQAPWSP